MTTNGELIKQLVREGKTLPSHGELSRRAFLYIEREGNEVCSDCANKEPETIIHADLLPPRVFRHCDVCDRYIGLDTDAGEG